MTLLHRPSIDLNMSLTTLKITFYETATTTQDRARQHEYWFVPSHFFIVQSQNKREEHSVLSTLQCELNY